MRYGNLFVEYYLITPDNISNSPVQSINYKTRIFKTYFIIHLLRLLYICTDNYNTKPLCFYEIMYFLLFSITLSVCAETSCKYLCSASFLSEPK